MLCLINETRTSYLPEIISRIILLPDSVPEDYNNYSLWTGAA